MENKENFGCFPIYGLESEDEDHGTNTPSNPATPATPNTPHTPASDETDRSAFSVSIDSGIESPEAFQLPGNHLQPMGAIHNMIPTPRPPSKAACKQNDHTTKEKYRRERIKDSCDQLRVLLPYIRGRKTDMASILEMCVDYLQIVNTVMPQQLHNQIVDILSKDPSLVPNKDMKANKARRNSKEIESPTVSRVTSTVDSPASHTAAVSDCNPPGVITFQAQDVTKRDFPADVHPIMTEKSNKRLRIGPDGVHTVITEDNNLVHNTHNLPTAQIDNRYDHGSVEEDFNLFSGAQKPVLHSKSAFSDVDSYGRAYNHPTTESFTAGQLYNTYAAAKTQTLERDSYQVYMDAPLYRYYYSGLHQQNVGAQSRFFSETMDYVNPNSVLSTASYGNTPGSSNGSCRLKLEGGEVIEEFVTPDSENQDHVEVSIIENSP